MQRLFTASVLGLVFAVLAAPASAQTVYFSEGFETADGHTAGNDIIGTNGWYQGYLGGDISTAQQVSAGAPGLNGQVGDAKVVSGREGSYTQLKNDAGISGGLNAGTEYIFSWKQLVNSGGIPTQGA